MIIDDLIAVKGLVSQGWCQGQFWKDTVTRVDMVCPKSVSNKIANCWCLAGALHHVTDGQEDGTNRYDRMVNALGFIESRAMFIWNDEPGRTQQQVIERVYDAIDRLQNCHV